MQSIDIMHADYKSPPKEIAAIFQELSRAHV